MTAFQYDGRGDYFTGSLKRSIRFCDCGDRAGVFELNDEPPLDPNDRCIHY
ncbi:MAG: hypothetical protein AAF542_22190 [Pseudomonadota bacterium]